MLGLSSEPVIIPPALADSLETWFINIGAGANLIAYQVGTQIEVVEQWKALQPEERARLLNDAWAFKEFLFTRHFISQTLANNQTPGESRRKCYFTSRSPMNLRQLARDARTRSPMRRISPTSSKNRRKMSTGNCSRSAKA